MKLLRQIAAVTAMNIRSLPQRLSTSLVTVIGIAGVVGVLVSVLAMSTGILQTMRNAGRIDRAIVLRDGAAAEAASALPLESARIVLDAPGIKKDVEGQPIASTEGVRLFNLKRRQDGAEMGVILRGVGPQFLALRPEIRLIEGRMFQPALNELIVGRAAVGQFQGMSIGDHLEVKNTRWTVVGVFSSNGDVHESELMTSIETLRSTDQRGIQSVTVMLESPHAFQQFSEALSSNPALAVSVERELDYLTRQSKTMTRVLSIVAYLIGGIMACGAMFAALNTMYSAVSTRSREIAILRAFGFGSEAMVVSVLLESLLLSVVGGALGAAMAWLLFSGQEVGTSASAQGMHHVVFELSVTWPLALLGMIWSCVIGLAGGLLPAIRAARLPIAMALTRA